MTTLSVIFMTTTAVLAVVCAFIAHANFALNDKYQLALDKLDLAAEADPGVDKNHVRLLTVAGYQHDLLCKLLFGLLLDLVNESDEGVAINRLITLRDNVTTLNESNSRYVRDNNKLVNVENKKNMNSIMCWLCSVLDVRNGKEELSAGAYLEYNSYKNMIIKEQQSILKLNDEIAKEDQYQEESSQEDYEDDYQEQEETEEPLDNTDVWEDEADWDEEDEFDDEPYKNPFADRPYEVSKNPFKNFVNGTKALFKGYQG